MSRKKLSKKDRLAREAQRRIASVTRLAAVHAEELAARTAAVVLQVRQLRVEALRSELAEASARHASRDLLTAALRPGSPFPWEPWGYEVERPEPRQPIAQMRLIRAPQQAEPIFTFGGRPYRRLAVAA